MRLARGFFALLIGTPWACAVSTEPVENSETRSVSNPIRKKAPKLPGCAPDGDGLHERRAVLLESVWGRRRLHSRFVCSRSTCLQASQELLLGILHDRRRV